MSSMFCIRTVTCACPLTWTQLLRGHPYPHAGCRVGGARLWQEVAAGELELHEKHGVGSGDGVLGMAEVVLQGLALIPTELAPLRSPRAVITQREDVIAEGRDGEPGALI